MKKIPIFDYTYNIYINSSIILLMKEGLKLKDGDRVVIIGGGPAGSFFAHFLHKFAGQKGIRLAITIFDGKDFLQKGPKGCNLCAGVVAESLNQKLISEEIHLPEKRIISRLDGYHLHVNDENLLLSDVNKKDNTITTVFRGNGPRFSEFDEVISFDDFLLSWTQDLGTELIASPVWDIKTPEDRWQPLTIVFGDKDNPQEIEAELVVGAFGVNAYMLNKLKNMGFGYRAPTTLVTYQAEIKLSKEKILKNFGNAIHVYMPKSQTIRFATVIPKGEYITITLIGKKNVTKDILQEFLSLREIQEKIPLCIPQCFCLPKITISPAKKPFTDRLVIIGDASCSRHYKNGIESAFLTARLAAETAIFYGVSDSQFKKRYFRQAKKLIIRDNIYGRVLFFINDFISSIPILTQSHLSLAKKFSTSGPPQKIREILWNMFTGNIPYRDILKASLDLRLQFSLLVKTSSILLKKIKARITG
jgi:flavin-dependent dehydrogenase